MEFADPSLILIQWRWEFFRRNKGMLGNGLIQSSSDLYHIVHDVIQLIPNNITNLSIEADSG